VAVIRDESGRPVGMRGVTMDITDRRRAEQVLRQLTGRLLRLQDEERRRIARELHDVTAQNLVAIMSNFAYLRRLRAELSERARGVLSETIALGEQVLQEIRTLSYVLHPPLLDQAGLVSALQWYADGFAKRSGIEGDLDLAEVGRLPGEVENALFRVVQECLANVSRHSGSRTAGISLARDEALVVLRVEDEGRGMPEIADELTPDARTLGVGIPGMRERLRQLGGELSIQSRPGGTVVTAIVSLEGGGQA
jgi:signal transduction histidine kinase